MRATVMFGAGDVRVEKVPDAHLIEPTDALLTITRACICGSDLWPYKNMEPSKKGQRMGRQRRSHRQTRRPRRRAVCLVRWHL